MLNDFIAQARDNQSVKVSIEAKELKPGSGRGNPSSHGTKVVAEGNATIADTNVWPGN